MIKKPGLKIKNIRELKNYTQEYMADQLNLSTRAYSKIESGETELTIKRLNQISVIFNMSSIDLLCFDELQMFVNYTLIEKEKVLTSDVVNQLKETIILLKEQNKALTHIFEKQLS